MPIDMSMERFEELVTDALDALPDQAVEGLDNVIFQVEDRDDEDDDLELLGLYHGSNLHDRSNYGFGELPDRIVLYRLPLLNFVDSEDELREQIHVTLMHEIAHYFGLEDNELHQLGWG